MLSIVLITPPIAALAAPPCLIVTIRVSLKFGALGERPYDERIWLQMKLREEKNAVREFRRCEERGDMFRCLVVCINLVKIYYVHARARYILLSQAAARWVPGRQERRAERCLSSPSPSRRQDNIDRASQVLAQGVNLGGS